MREEILELLISRNLIYKGQRIYYSDIQRSNDNNSDYNEPLFVELYELCKDKCTEKELASILEITRTSFSANRQANKKNRFYIKVFDKQELTENEKKECIEYIKEKYCIGKSYTQKAGGIYYSKVQMLNCRDFDYKGPFFEEIYQELPTKFKIKCSEKELADIFGISYFIDFKKPNNKSRRTIFWEVEEADKGIQEQILEHIVKKYSLYKGQRIWDSRDDTKEYNGEIFLQEMYDELPNEFLQKITKKELANILGIKRIDMNKKMTILTEQSLNEKEKAECQEYLIKRYKLRSEYSKIGIFYSRKQKENSADINYSGPYITDMYEELPDYFRAKCTIYELIEILGVENKRYRMATYENSKNKIVILKDQVLSQEEQDEINDLIRKLEYKKIRYDDGENSLKSMIKKYDVKITEREFAHMLGITPYFFRKIKSNPNAVAPVINREKNKKTAQVLNGINETRYYTIQELEELCQEADISVQDFLIYMYTGGRYNNSYMYTRLLKNRSIFIVKPETRNGVIRTINAYPMSEEVFTKLYYIFYEKVKKSAINMIKIYGGKEEFEDIVQIGMSSICLNCGDIEKNFYQADSTIGFESNEDEEWFYKCIIGRAKKNMRNYIFCLKRLDVNFQKNKQRLVKNYHEEEWEIDESEIIQEDDEILQANKFGEIVESYLDQGVKSFKEILRIIIEEYDFSIEKINLWLEILKKQMIEKKRLVNIRQSTQISEEAEGSR